MREVDVIGVGMHEFGRFPGKTYPEIARDAVRNALKDAGVNWKEVQAVYCSHSYGGTGAGCNVVRQLGTTGIPIFNVEAGCAGGAISFAMAYEAIAAGYYDIACAVGFEKMPRGVLPADQFPEWTRVTGMMMYPILEAWTAQRYMREYGVTREQLAKVAIRSHNNASLHPYAHYRNNANMTVEEVLNARMICDPLTIMQIAPVSEGAAAAILCAKEVARRRFSKKKRVTVAAISKVSSLLYTHPYSLLDFMPSSEIQSKIVAEEAYKIAGCEPEDLDLVCCEDAYTIAEIHLWPGIGLCRPEDVGRLIDEGATEITGRIPVNTDGGMMSRGNPIGACAMAAIIELVWQLRGEAGPRQVKDAKIGLELAAGIGPVRIAVILKR